MIDILDLGLLGIKLSENFGWVIVGSLEDSAHIRVQVNFFRELLIHLELVSSTIVV